jgi:hypothetical protein
MVSIFDPPAAGPINFGGCFGAKSGRAREDSRTFVIYFPPKKVRYLLGVKDSRMFFPRWPGFGARLYITNTRKAHALDYLDRDVIVTY